MTTREPSHSPLSTREIQTLPEGARVIVTWAEGNDGPPEYRALAPRRAVRADR